MTSVDTNQEKEPIYGSLVFSVLFAATYFAAAEIGHALSFPGHIASFWPASGVYLAVLLVNRPCRWPLFIIAAVAGNLSSAVWLHGKSIPVGLALATGNTLEAVAGAWFLLRLCGSPFTLTRLNNVLTFFAVSALFSVAIGATVGAAIIEKAFGDPYWLDWLKWWSGGIVGVLVVAPLMLKFLNEDPDLLHSVRPGRIAEVVFLMAGLALNTEIVFGHQSYELSWTVVPFLLWAALRFEQTGVAWATGVVTIFAVWNTILGLGPFAAGGSSGIERILLVQSFSSIFAVAFLIVGAVVSEVRTLGNAARQGEQRWRELFDEKKQQEQQLEAYRLQLEDANVHLQALATTDGLTRLKNRRAFQEHLADEIERAARYGTPLSLLLLDVDHFKQFNDTFGHPAGDRTLRAVARLLEETARSTDFVARYGGEEFAILLPNTDQCGADALADRFRSAVEEWDWGQRAITVSVGASTLTPGERNGARLIDEADAALYLSKKNGRNCVHHAWQCAGVAIAR
jgi:diguanylate cyclase (GGDEF)-like protein